jgi:CheY-like chemotaxis protein
MTAMCKNPGECFVVLVEDDVLLRMVLTIQLESTSINFCAASDGYEALALIRTHHPKVLLLDVSLPGLSGFEVVEAMRQDPALSDLSNMALIVHTSLELSHAEQERLSFGRTQFLTKTKIGKELYEIVTHALENRG